MTLFHRHDRLSRVFTVRGTSYRVCLDCGAELEYSLSRMQLTGRVIERTPERPDVVAQARDRANVSALIPERSTR